MWPPPAGGNSSASGGLVGDIAGEDEFSMDSEINRMLLQGTNPHGTDNTNKPKVPAVACDQGRVTRYTGCLPRRKGDPLNRATQSMTYATVSAYLNNHLFEFITVRFI